MRWFLLCLLLVGCTPAPTPGPTRPPPPSVTVAGSSSVGVLEILPVASTTATVADAPSWRPGGVLKHLPARCDYGRIYINVDELFAGGGTAALARLAAAKPPVDKDGKTIQTLVNAFEKAGKNAFAATKEVAICFESSDKTRVVALRIDLEGLDGPAAIVTKAIAESEGKPPKVETAGGFVWIEHRDGQTVAVGNDLIVYGHSRKAVEGSVLGSSAASEFDDAGGQVIWAHLRENDALVKLRAIGADFDFQLEMHLGPSAGSIVSSWRTMLPQLDAVMTADAKLTPLAPLMPALQRASIQASGEQVTVSTRMPKTVVTEILQRIVDAPVARGGG